MEQPATSVRQKLIKTHMQQQQEARSRVRHQKLKITFFGYVVVLIFFLLLQIISVFFFTSGFLLSRDVAPDVASCADPLDTCMARPAVPKAIVLIVDALRFDFVVPVEASDKFYHNNFPVLYETAQKHPDRAALLKFMADPPTTTLQRLKGLTTGSLPTFLDAGSNFDGDAIDEDNWLLQLHRQNRSIAFMGDDTWTALFDAYICPTLNFPYPSLNVWDIHTVDNGVLEHMYPLLEPARAGEWDLLVGHFLGVDHIGHRYGPNHPSMRDKLRQMDAEIARVMELMDDSTLLVVMGDHGMDSTGNHGGDSPDELESTLFVYSKNKNLIRQKPASFYDVAGAGRNYRAVNQVDLVPTMSLLMGLPIPHNNLGFPIDELFANDKTLLEAAHKTLKQINNFRHSSPALANDHLNSLFDTFADNLAHGRKNTLDLIADAKAYQHLSLEHCKTLWARFDLPFIGIGIGLLLFSFSFVLTYSRSIPPVRVSTMSFEFIGSVIAMSLLGVVLSSSVYIVLQPENFTFRTCLSFGVAIGMVIGFWAPIMDRFSIDWLVHQIIDFFVYNFNGWSFLGLIFIVFHCLIFASNSFIIWEDKMVSFFIATFGACAFINLLLNTKFETAKRIIGLTHALTFLVVSRLISMVNLCREEQGGLCKPTFINSYWAVGLLHVLAVFLPLTIKSFYNLSNSYHSAGPLWIGTGMKFLLFMNAFYWTFEYIETNNLLANSNSFLTSTLLKSFRLAIARIVLVISLGLANYSWSRGPLCVKIDINNTDSADQVSPSPERSPEPDTESPDFSTRYDGDEEEEEPVFKPTATILGYGNIYGSSYFLLVINFTIAIMLVSKPLGALVIGGLIVQILSLLELFDILDIRRNLICPILFGLLGYQSFFSTGHQATIPSIQWDVGFMTTETIVMPFTHINIVLNTFGSFIIVCLAIPLVILWKIPPTSKPVTTLSQVITVLTSLITYQTLVSLSSFIFTAHFRRHLMVWKIFAPRFMLNGLVLILVNVVLIFITLWFGTSKVLTQVNRIFGK